MGKRLFSAQKAYLAPITKTAQIAVLFATLAGLLFAQIQSPTSQIQARVLNPNYTKNLLAEIDQIRTEEAEENSRYSISERYRYEIIDQEGASDNGTAANDNEASDNGTTSNNNAASTDDTSNNNAAIIYADPGEEFSLEVTLKNTGKSSWLLTEGVENQLVLGAYPQDRQPKFTDAKIQIKDKNGKEIIGPDKETTFTINIKSPETPGVYIEEFAPLISGEKWLNNDKLSWEIIVGEDFTKSLKYKIQEQEINRTARPNVSTEIKIQITNASETTWYGGRDASRGGALSEHTVQLIADDKVTAQTIGIYSDPVSTMSEQKVQPGETATFTFDVSPPSITGSYRLRLRLSIAGLFTLDRDPLDINITSAGKVVAITIDDGYGDIEDFVEVLNENNVKATFFILGVVAQNDPEGMKAIIESGHLLASHSYIHPNFNTLSTSEIRNQLNTTRDAIINATGGYDPYPYFRYPGGDHSQRTDAVLAEDGWEFFHWTNGTGDFKYRANTSAGRSHILYYATAGAPDKAIVLLHTMSKSTLAVLPDIINWYRDRGYAFVTVDQL
jgi:peptidoglycan/xylan/chitin deacetylase (PgdA/CDA1 family)